MLLGHFGVGLVVVVVEVEAWSYCVVQAGLQLTNLLPQPPVGWDSRHVLLHPDILLCTVHSIVKPPKRMSS